MTIVLSKRETQSLVRNLRAGGYEVTKTSSDCYVVEMNGVEIFRAMPGSRAYLVRADDRLLTRG